MTGRPLRLAVIGTGRVGLVAGAGLADAGNQVCCVDLDEDRVAGLRRGEIAIHEPGLGELVRTNLAAGRLTFTSHLAAAVAGADVVFLAVGTPHRELDGGADLRGIDAAAAQVGRALTGFAVIVTKSTVPVGTADRLRAIIAAETAQPFVMASNPEFMREGAAVNDFTRPARVILGVDDERTARTLRALYAPFVATADLVITMDVRSAELTKYAANAMLAVRISFMNELALLAEQVGADIEQVRAGVGSDPRIGPRHLASGAGFGGSCLPKDLEALAHTAKEWGVSADVVEAAARANVRHKRVLGARVKAHFGPALPGRRIAVWGLAFKPDTDDIREAPALTVISDLIAAGAHVVGYDPAAMAAIRARLGDRIELAPDLYAAAHGAHGLVVVTEWDEFRGADLGRVRAVMADPVIFDGRNLWPPDAMRGLGFRYYAIGRGSPR